MTLRDPLPPIRSILIESTPPSHKVWLNDRFVDGIAQTNVDGGRVRLTFQQPVHLEKQFSIGVTVTENGTLKAVTGDAEHGADVGHGIHVQPKSGDALFMNNASYLVMTLEP